MKKTDIPLTGRNLLIMLGVIVTGVSVVFGIAGLAYLTALDFGSTTFWALLVPVHFIIALLFVLRSRLFLFDRYDWFRVLAYTYVMAAGVGALNVGFRYLDSLVWSGEPFFQQIAFEREDLRAQIVLWAIFTIPYWVFIRLDINNLD